MKLLILLSSLTLSSLIFAEPRPVDSPVPAKVVSDFSLSPFYKKCVLADGFPIVSSEKVHDAALQEAAYLIDIMLVGHDDIRKELIKNKVRFSIMARGEFTTAIPEHSKLAPVKYWDRRARGLGATPQSPAVSCGEENLLCISGDPYAKENILIHEFAHAIDGMGLHTLRAGFTTRLNATYAAAMKAGLWKGKYAASNPSEYWAEAVQSWFGTNRENDHDHNHVNTRKELVEYDPAIAKLVQEVFGDAEWSYQRPEARAEKLHFTGFDASKEAAFAWPATEFWTEPDLMNVEKKLEGLKDLGLLQPPGETPLPASSRPGGKSELVVVNLSGKVISVVWMDEKGEKQPRQDIQPNRLSFQTTSAGHVFGFYDDNASLLGGVTAEEGDCRVIVK